MRLSRLNLIALLGVASLFLIAITVAILAYTPARELIPGYDSNVMSSLLANTLRLDSLEHEMEIREKYYNNIRAIISGENPDSFEEAHDATIPVKEVSFDKSPYDSLLRKQIEKEEQFNLILAEQDASPINFSNIHFFVPLKGVVSNSFNMNEDHFGVDIVSAPNKLVSAVLGGTVTMANWTLATGYVIMIQHDNNLISVYKHNSQLLKKEGNVVKPGDAIAIVGNSGELTTGPHLHFELWHSGKALNPEDFIPF